VLHDTDEPFQFLTDVHQEQNAVVLQGQVLSIEDDVHHTLHHVFFFEIDDARFPDFVQSDEHQNLGLKGVSSYHDCPIQNRDVRETQELVQSLDQFQFHCLDFAVLWLSLRSLTYVDDDHEGHGFQGQFHNGFSVTSEKKLLVKISG
jgi:hypothetical protein